MKGFQFYLSALILLILPTIGLASKALYCSGTEPFWGLSITKSKFIFDRENKKTHIKAVTPRTSANRPLDYLRVYRTKTNDNRLVIIAIRKTNCSDDMSDHTYKYNVLYIMGKKIYDGCCELK